MSHHWKFINLRKSKKDNRLIDKLCSLFAVLMPLTTLPQIYEIYVNREVQGISLMMWVLYTIGVIPFLAYGLVHRVGQLIVLNTLWVMVNLLIILGIIIHS